MVRKNVFSDGKFIYGFAPKGSNQIVVSGFSTIDYPADMTVEYGNSEYSPYYAIVGRVLTEKEIKDLIDGEVSVETLGEVEKIVYICPSCDELCDYEGLTYDEALNAVAHRDDYTRYDWENIQFKYTLSRDCSDCRS